MINFFSHRSFRRFYRFITFVVSIFVLVLAGTLYPFLSGSVLAADTPPVYPGVHPTPLIDIRDVINVKGPDNTKAVTMVPTKPITLKTNAVDAASEDFIANGTSYNKASIFATVTIARPYEHTYQICNRWAGYALDNLVPVGIPNLVSDSQRTPTFWSLSMSKEGVVEKAFSFAVLVNEAGKTFTVDAALWPWNIPLSKSPGYNYIFNMQIWAGSQQDADLLLHNVLSRLSSYQGWQVNYANSDAVQPPFFIKDADKIHMRLQSLLPETQKVSLECSARYPNDKSKSVSQTFDVVLNPGLNTIDLPFTNALDATINVKTKGFMDQTYVGIGYWFGFGKNINRTEVQAVDLPPLAQEDFLLGSSGMKGRVLANSGGGLARTLNPNSLPVDINKYKSLSFWARGDGKSYSVQLETKAVRDKNSSDFHQFVITTTPEWNHYLIPLSSFKQTSTDPNKTVPFTGTDVISAAWRTIGAPLDSVNLEVCNAGFSNQ